MYNPREESSAGYEEDGLLVIKVKEGTRGMSCFCGCGEYPVNRHRKKPGDRRGVYFAMGHDMRMRGMLARAHMAGVKVKFVMPDGRSQTVTAMSAARRFGKTTHLEKAERAKAAEVLKVAEHVKSGRDKVLRVGKTPTQAIVAVFELKNGTHLVESVDLVGERRTVRLSAYKLELTRWEPPEQSPLFVDLSPWPCACPRPDSD